MQACRKMRERLICRAAGRRGAQQKKKKKKKRE